jgi:uncharacterized protein YheU (UPF0270 family)
MGVTTIVPWRRLDAETLKSVLESFINREGTDYGEVELSLEEKVAHLKGQLERREVFIVFDGETESVTLVTSRDAAYLRAQLADEGYEHAEEPPKEGE